MKLSVIIPCYNAARTITIQLEALAQQSWEAPWEVIVSDNGSSDDTPTIVQQYQCRWQALRWVDASDRRGPAHARNVGARVALGEALAFVDADDEVAPGWVAAIGNALGKYDFVASRFDIAKLNPPWVQRSHSSLQSKGLMHYNYPRYLPHASGSGLGIKRALHEAIGGFDDAFLYLQDTDYCWKAQRAGAQLYFAPEAVIHYRYRQTLRGLYQQARNYAEDNVLIYKKYRALDMPPLTRYEIVRAWVQLFRRTIGMRSKGDFARWLWNVGWRVGRLHGSIKHRIWAP